MDELVELERKAQGGIYIEGTRLIDQRITTLYEVEKQITRGVMALRPDDIRHCCLKILDNDFRTLCLSYFHFLSQGSVQLFLTT
jgi:hypothetical protein